MNFFSNKRYRPIVTESKKLFQYIYIFLNRFLFVKYTKSNLVQRYLLFSLKSKIVCFVLFLYMWSTLIALKTPQFIYSKPHSKDVKKLSHY